MPRAATIDRTLVARLHAAGHADAAIGRAVGCTPQSATRVRRRLGLPRNPHPCRGVPNPGKAARALARRQAKYAALAAAYGLPADLRPTQVRMVVAMAAGPLPLARLPGCRQQGGLSLTADLIRRGLVAYLHRADRGPGYGRRRPGLYALTAAALDMLCGGGR